MVIHTLTFARSLGRSLKTEDERALGFSTSPEGPGEY